MSEKTLSAEKRRVTVEDVLGWNGFRVRWSVLDHWADVEAWSVLQRDVNGFPEFARKDWASLPSDATEDVDSAEVYLRGFVKWDGCTELGHGGNLTPHFCGAVDLARHVALLKYIYTRAFELMGREPDEPWWDEPYVPDPDPGPEAGR